MILDDLLELHVLHDQRLRVGRFDVGGGVDVLLALFLVVGVHDEHLLDACDQLGVLLLDGRLRVGLVAAILQKDVGVSV